MIWPRRFCVRELAGFFAVGCPVFAGDAIVPEGSKELLATLKNYPHKIVYETNRDGNWELYLVNADGSNPVNLTNTKDVDGLYPKPSPDGTKLCFIADEKKAKGKVRNAYVMTIDATQRTKVAN